MLCQDLCQLYNILILGKSEDLDKAALWRFIYDEVKYTLNVLNNGLMDIHNVGLWLFYEWNVTLIYERDNKYMGKWTGLNVY